MVWNHSSFPVALDGLAWCVTLHGGMLAPSKRDPVQTMDLVMRTFFIDKELALRLSNRASLERGSVGDLVRMFVENYVSGTSWQTDQDKTDGMVLRSYYLTREQDILLDILAEKFHTTKGNVFRSAIADGMGIANRGIK